MDEKMNTFLCLMNDAFSAAVQAHKYSFESEDGKRAEDRCVAMSYAAVCTAKYSAAEAIYWTTPDLAHSEIPDIFAQFDTFTTEVLTDFATDHSRQWVDIEFNELRKRFENSVCNQPISE